MKTKNILILDYRPLQNSKLNGVTITAKNWFNELLKHSNNFDQIIIWSNSNKKQAIKLNLEIPTNTKNKIQHIHTHYSNLFLSLLWKTTNFLPIEKILKINKTPNSQITYFCPDLRPINLLPTTKSYLYIHDVAFLKFSQFYSLKSRIFYQILNPYKTVKKATYILTNSKFSKSELTKYLKIPSKKIKIAYPQLDWELYEQSLNNRVEIKNQFLCLGAFQKRKNTDQIIKSFLNFHKKNLKHKNYKLILIGDYDPTFSKYKLANHPNIEIKSQITETEKIQLIQESKALIYTPIYEGFGMPILEAITLQKPIITSSLKVFKEIFKNYPIYLKNSTELETQLEMFAEK